MNTKKKIILTSMSGLILAAPIATAISCGHSTENWKNSKTIIVSVDGAQQKMYEEAIKEFNKTDAHTKEGFVIKTINKNVFGALDMIKTVGFTDENVGDLLYMPQDRMTDMLQQKALMPWTPAQFKDMLNTVNATPAEVTSATNFVSARFHGRETQFAFPHNKEGTAIASAQDLTTASMEIQKEGMFGLQNKAEGLFRLQDMWYGSGLFANKSSTNTKVKEILTKKILYGDGNQWDSAFIKNNASHSEMKKVTDAISDMWFEPLAKAYIPAAPETLIGQEWHNSKMTPDMLKNFFQNDMGAVNNMLIDSVQTGKLKYIMAGTWDAQNLAKRGIKTLINTPKALAGSVGQQNGNNLLFAQASGTWSFGINARNNGANPKRIKALHTLLKKIYSASSFTEYFEQDSKVPWFNTLQNDVKTEVAKIKKPKIKDAIALFDKLKQAQKINTNPTTDTEKIEELAKYVNGLTGAFDKLKELKVSNEWSGPKTVSNPKLPNNLGQNYNVYTSNKYQDTIGLIDAMQTLLDVNDLTNNKKIPAWQVSSTHLKKAWADIPDSIKQDKTNKTVHIRKLAKIWTGFDGDNGDEKALVMKQFEINSEKATTKAQFDQSVVDAKAKFDALIVKQIKQTEKFVSAYSNAASPITPTRLTETVTKYFNNFWNEKLRDAQYKFIIKNVVSNLDLGDTPPTSLVKGKTISSTAQKTLSLNNIYDLISSNASTASGQQSTRGKMELQDGRFDNLNPQFGSVWGLWNDSTFGNKIFLQKTIKDVVTTNKTRAAAQLAFQQAIENHLDKLFKQRVEALQKANAQGSVKL